MYPSRMRIPSLSQAIRCAALVLPAALAAATLRAQEFVPPDRATRPAGTPAPRPDSARSGLRVDLFGFSTRGGAQLSGGSQAVLGSTIDVAQLWTPRLRVRPSFAVGFGRGANKSLAVNLEVVYRFQPEEAAAIPYFGLGAGYYDDDFTRRGWPTLTIGFELPFRRTMNWLIEYQALDTMRRSRLMVGLATRNGGN